MILDVGTASSVPTAPAAAASTAAAPAAAVPAATAPTAAAPTAAAQGAADSGGFDLGALGLGSFDLSKIDVLKTSLTGAGVLIALLLAFFAVRRLRKPAIVTLGDAEGSCGICVRVRAWLQRMLAAIDYLSTRREWRYAQPWLLVLGERSAGKSSFIASVSETWRHHPPKHADQLQAEGMQWSYFRYGVLIDGDGVLAAADEGAPEAKQWNRGLKALNDLRPERPLDGLVLCVSSHWVTTT